MSAGARSARLREEILRLSGRGWSLEDGRTEFEAVVSYPLPPGGLQFILELIVGIFTGSMGGETETRRLRIRVDEDGVIQRRTLTELPSRRRRRGRAWEVPDTEGPAVRMVFDGQRERDPGE